MPSVEQLMLGGELGAEISASDGGFTPLPSSLLRSSASSRFEVAESPSAGPSRPKRPALHPAASRTSAG